MTYQQGLYPSEQLSTELTEKYGNNPTAPCVEINIMESERRRENKALSLGLESWAGWPEIQRCEWQRKHDAMSNL